MAETSESNRRKTSSDLEHVLGELEELERRRHQERTQIIVALAILGAYATVYSTGGIGIPLLDGAAAVFAVVNFLFLLVKLTINTSIPIGELGAFERIDPYAPFAYLFSVWGFSILIGIVAVVRTFDLTLPSAPTIVSALGSFLLIPFLIAVFYLGAKRRKKAIDRQHKYLRESFPNAIGALEQGGVVESTRSDALEARFEQLLAQDRNPSLVHLLSYMFFDQNSEPLKLAKKDRERLVNVVKRVNTKAEYGETDEEDFNKIRDIIERAEERTPV